MSTAAIHYPGSNPPFGNSGLVGLWRLMWKEYRSLRWFWLAIAVLVVLMDYLMLEFGGRANAAIIYNFALGAPVMFAIGAAAPCLPPKKKKEPTNFSSHPPPPPGKSSSANGSSSRWRPLAWLSCFCRLADGFSATSAARGKWTSSIYAFSGTLPHWRSSPGALCFHCSPPAVIRCYARYACRSRRAHLLSWTELTSHHSVFEPEAYIHAAGLRAAVAILLLVVDAYLASRWLQRYLQKTRVEFTFKIHRAGATTAPCTLKLRQLSVSKACWPKQ